MTDDEIRSAWVSLHGSLPPAWAYEFGRQIEQASRHAALEEAAKHVETLGLVFFFGEKDYAKDGRACTAAAIRALTSP